MSDYYERQKKYAKDIEEIFGLLQPYRENNPDVENSVQDFIRRVGDNCPRLKTMEDKRNCIAFIYQLAWTRKLIDADPEGYRNPNK
jgi:hypothetical protein